MEQENGDGQNMIIILNPNGTINEELMLANGVNQDTIRAVANGGLVNLLDPAANIKNLQHPIPQKDLGDVKPLMTTASIPRTVMETVQRDSENGRSVILDQKDNFLVLDDLDKDGLINNIELPVSMAGGGAKIININGTQHIITNSARAAPRMTTQFIPGVQKTAASQEQFILPTSLPITPLGTLDLSLPKKPDPSVLEQYVNPGALVSENTVLKALAKPDSGNIVTKDHLTGKVISRTGGGKVRRVRPKGDENGNGAPYVHRKTTSLGALGQALHGPMMGELLFH